MSSINLKTKRELVDYRLKIAEPFLTAENLIKRYDVVNTEAVIVMAPAASALFTAYHNAFRNLQLTAFGMSPKADEGFDSHAELLRDPRTNPFHEANYSKIIPALDMSRTSVMTARLLAKAQPENTDIAMLLALNIEAVFVTIIRCLHEFLDFTKPSEKGPAVDFAAAEYYMSAAGVYSLIIKDE